MNSVINILINTYDIQGKHKHQDPLDVVEQPVIVTIKERYWQFNIVILNFYICFPEVHVANFLLNGKESFTFAYY